MVQFCVCQEGCANDTILHLNIPAKTGCRSSSRVTTHTDGTGEGESGVKVDTGGGLGTDLYRGTNRVRRSCAIAELAGRRRGVEGGEEGRLESHFDSCSLQ